MLFFVLFISLLVVLVVYLVFFLIFYKVMLDLESMSPYECGFEPNSLSRVTFSYRFFLISILFLIFDVELSLMLPIPFLVSSLLGVWIFLIFVFILIVGLLYEYYYGSLDWLDNYISKA